MLDRLEAPPFAAPPLEAAHATDRVAQAITARLEIVEPWREAVRRALTVLALPQNAPLGLRLLYATVDAIWYAAGDAATDVSFYTKRLDPGPRSTRPPCYTELEDQLPEGFADTRAFIDRRLARAPPASAGSARDLEDRGRAAA